MKKDTQTVLLLGGAALIGVVLLKGAKATTTTTGAITKAPPGVQQGNVASITPAAVAQTAAAVTAYNAQGGIQLKQVSSAGVGGSPVYFGSAPSSGTIFTPLGTPVANPNASAVYVSVVNGQTTIVNPATGLPY